MDDEITTEEDEKDIEQARKNIVVGQGTSLDEFKKEFGL